MLVFFVNDVFYVLHFFGEVVKNLSEFIHKRKDIFVEIANNSFFGCMAKKSPKSQSFVVLL